MTVRFPLASWFGARSRAAFPVVATFAFAVVYPLSPFATCPVAQTFHVPCPGCGSTRAVVAAVRGHVGEALLHNAMALPLVALLGLIFARTLQFAFRGDVRRVESDRLIGYAARALVVVWALQLVVYLLRFGGLFGGPEPVG